MAARTPFWPRGCSRKGQPAGVPFTRQPLGARGSGMDGGGLSYGRGVKITRKGGRARGNASGLQDRMPPRAMRLPGPGDPWPMAGEGIAMAFTFEGLNVYQRALKLGGLIRGSEQKAGSSNER